MTRRSIAEYAGAVRGRYSRATKKAKTEMLNEFVATTGMHRKAVTRLLNRRSRSSGSKKRGHPRLYRREAIVALKVVWKASDFLCSKRLQPFMLELVSILKRCGELTVTTETEAELCQMSPYLLSHNFWNTAVLVLDSSSWIALTVTGSSIQRLKSTAVARHPLD